MIDEFTVDLLICCICRLLLISTLHFFFVSTVSQFSSVQYIMFSDQTVDNCFTFTQFLHFSF
jgi:hypothetical protein